MNFLTKYTTHLLSATCCLLLFTTAFTQNLVPNPSFESYFQCPTSSANFDSDVEDWYATKETPEYYNSCATNSSVSVPGNSFGFHNAATGIAYAGIVTYINTVNFTESIGVQLIDSLTIDEKYYISFKVALANNITSPSVYASDKIGVLFSTLPNSILNSTPINNFAHMYTDSIITDTANWVTISGQFVADSSYKYLSIGNFFDKNNTDTFTIINDYYDPYEAYYYIDDVCVSLDSLICKQQVGIKEEEQGETTFSIYPNPITDFLQIEQTKFWQYDITITNILGQKLYEEKNVTDVDKMINMTAYTEGILLITIQTLNQSINYKFLKL